MAAAKRQKFKPGKADYDFCRFESDTLILGPARMVVLGTEFYATKCQVLIKKGVELVIAKAEFRECEITSESSRQVAQLLEMSTKELRAIIASLRGVVIS